MKPVNGRGTGGIIYAQKNRARIKKWFESNNDKTIAECARSLRLTWMTVKKHVVAIQKGE